MQIIVHQDPATGLVTHTYIEDTPVEISPEEKKKDDDFWDNIFESTKNDNLRKKTLQESFWELNPEKFTLTFNNIYHNYCQEKKDDNNTTDIENLDKDFKRIFIDAFIDSLFDKDNQTKLKNNLEKVHEVWDTVINPKILTTLLWQMDFKEQSLKLLETTPSNFNSEQYDYLYDFVKEFRSRQLPLSSLEKDNILSEEKSNYLQIQNKYNTFKKINDKLVEKNIKTKHKKI